MEKDKFARGISMTCLGFIGTGNMGSALADAAAKILPGASILLNNRHEEKAQHLAQKLHAFACDKNTIINEADFIFLAVKPQGLCDLFVQLKPLLEKSKKNPVFVNMAAGTSIEKIQKLAGKNCPVIRIMPNTPVSVGEGVILYACSSEVNAGQCEEFLSCMSAAGSFYNLPEEKIDAASALSGCGPAFVDLFLEALADGAVACGLPRTLAYELASQTALGTAKLQLETGTAPAVLKDAVCSPGGTTIAGVCKLEEKGMRSAVIDAVLASYEKNKLFK